MRLIPSQTERQFFALLTLASLAFMFSSFWIAAQGSINSFWPTTIVLSSVAFLLTIAAVAGTRRKLVLAFVAAAMFFAISFLMKPLGVIGGDYWYTTNTNGTLSRFFFDQENRLEKFLGYTGAAYAIVLAISWASSFLFDRMLGRVGSNLDAEPQMESEKELETPAVRPSRLRFMIGLAGILFVVQLMGRVASLGTGDLSMTAAVPLVNSFAAPMGLVLVFILPAAIVCRIRSVFSPLIGLLLIATGIFSIAMQKGISPRSIPLSQQMIVVLGVALGVVFLITVLLIGKTNRQRTLRPSWLSLAGLGILAAAIFGSQTLDVATYCFSNKPFDWETAKIVHRMQNSDAVASEVSIDRLNFFGRFEFRSGVASVDFFNAVELPQGMSSHFLVLKGMTAEVDVSSLANVNFQSISLENCHVSLEQLASLKSSYLAITNCVLSDDSNDGKLPAPTNLHLADLSASEFTKWIEAFEPALLGANSCDLRGSDLSTDEALNGIREWLGNGGRIRTIDSLNDVVQMSRLPSTLDLENLTLSFGNKLQGERDAIRFILSRNVTSYANLAATPESMQILIAVPGKMGFGGDYEMMISNAFAQDELRKAGLVWGQVENEAGQGGDKITKLFLPLCKESVFDFVDDQKTLQSLSLDESWLRHESNVTRVGMGGIINETVDATKLASLTELRELYFSAYADIKDLRVLKPLRQLETLQVSTTSRGFSANQFSNLKHLRLYTVTQPSLALINELAKMKNLESVTIIDTAGTSSEETLRTRADGVLDPKIELSFCGLDTDLSSLAPAEFKAHQERVRQKCLSRFSPQPN